MKINGYLRADGRKGIRNVIVVGHLVECARHVATEIVQPFRDQGVHLIGFPGCFPNEYADKVMRQICTHPNVGGALMVSLGCEGFDRNGLREHVRDSGRPSETVIIQETGGTEKSVEAGRAWVEKTLAEIADVPRAEMGIDELVVGTICGGSDGTSGLTANPGIGRAFDKFIDAGAACVFEETGELIGCEHHMAARAATPELADEIISSVAKAAEYYRVLGHGSFAPGNADGGLTTLEEKSMGAYAKSGASTIDGLIKPGDVPPGGGLYLLDVVPDGEVRFGFPNISDNAEIVELMACGAHINLFATGRGSVVGSAISPLIKVCANPETFRRMTDDMDVDAGRVLEGRGDLDEIGQEIYDLTLRVAAGEKTKSEAMGHQEFILTYKSFDPIGPSCLPGSA
ncbi:MAG: UxaA family hydrolase [Rhodospirillales bacterium]|jgi:altronate dehydratase large subunit|nr:UxaA family hydrolase [Rhodospirillales bacterium]